MVADVANVVYEGSTQGWGPACPPEDVCLFWPDRPDDGMIYFKGPDES